MWRTEKYCCTTLFYLLRLQIADDGVDVGQELVNEGHDLADLNLDKLAPTFLRDFNESVASHVLKQTKSFISVVMLNQIV